MALKLDEYLNENVPQALFELAPNAYVSEVSDVEYSKVHIGESGVSLTGEALADIKVGHNGEALPVNMTLPFVFEIVMNGNLEIVDGSFVFDVSSWDA